MELDAYRRRAGVTGTVDVLLSICAILVAILWVGSSCESYPTEGGGGGRNRGRNSRTTNYSACHDARNTSDLEFGREPAKILLGNFLRVVIAHKEFASGPEMETYVLADCLLSVVQVGVACLVAKQTRHVEATKQELLSTGTYLILNSFIGVGYAIWREMEGALVGLILGGVIRGAMILIVGRFFLALCSDLVQGNGEKENNREVQVHYPPVAATPYIVAPPPPPGTEGHL